MHATLHLIHKPISLCLQHIPIRPVNTIEARTPESILKELENLLDKHEQARYPQSGSGDHGSAPLYHAYAGGPRETDPGLPNWKSNGSSRKLAFLTPGSPLWDLTTTCVLLANQITAPKEHNDWFRLNFNKSVFNLEIVTAEDEERYADLPPFEEMESEMGAYGTWLFRHDEEPESKTQNGISHYTIVIREKSLKKLAELCGISTTRAILYSYLHEL